MPPRRTSSRSKNAGEKRKKEDMKEENDESKVDAEDQHDDGQEETGSKKPGDAEDTKANADKGENEATKEEEGEPPKKAAKTSSPLEWLLSDEAFDMANPEIPQGHGEVDWEDGPHKKAPPSESAGKLSKSSSDKQELIRYPESHLTPFQNLIAACLLSKPISHKLGLRTIQTLLNPPFGLRTVKDLDEAGYEGRRKVMWEARTQHKEKTANQLGNVVDGVKELCGDKDSEEDLSELQGIRDKIKDSKSPEEAQKYVVDTLTTINGIGPGVASIFLRRVQGDWSEVFPYVDDKSVTAAKKFGLIDGDGGDEAAKQLSEKVGNDQKKMVRLLDVLIGLELEKVIDQAVEKAGS